MAEETTSDSYDDDGVTPPDEPGIEVDPPDTDEAAGGEQAAAGIGSDPGAVDDQELDDGDDPVSDLDTPGPAGGPTAGWGRVLLSQRNVAAVGRLILHHEARDVVLIADGDAAMRLIELYRRRNSPSVSARLEDPFDPQHSDATHGWVSVDLDDSRLLAISWLPSLGPQRPRTVIDPAVG